MANAPRSAPRLSGSEQVQALLEGLDHPHKAGIEALRALILALDPRIKEEVKWSAPSFLLDTHFATFKLRPPTRIELVLHTGAKARATPLAMQVPDPRGMLKWAAQDRCVMSLASFEDLEARRDAVEDVLKLWIAQLEQPPA